MRWACLRGSFVDPSPAAKYNPRLHDLYRRAKSTTQVSPGKQGSGRCGGDYTSQRGLGPRRSLSGRPIAYPGTARASATEVDERRTGSSRPQRGCGEVRGLCSSTWSTSGRRAVPGISQSLPLAERFPLVTPTRVVQTLPKIWGPVKKKIQNLVQEWVENSITPLE